MKNGDTTVLCSLVKATLTFIQLGPLLFITLEGGKKNRKEKEERKKREGGRKERRERGKRDQLIFLFKWEVILNPILRDCSEKFMNTS